LTYIDSRYILYVDNLYMSNISFLLFPVNLQHGRDPAADSKKRIKADSTAEHHHREDMSPPKYGPVQ